MVRAIPQYRFLPLLVLLAPSVAKADQLPPPAARGSAADLFNPNAQPLPPAPPDVPDIPNHAKPPASAAPLVAVPSAPADSSVSSALAAPIWEGSKPNDRERRKL